jgi:tripartite-type tricarboxylate transporter receptor subunit TctC
LNPWKRLQSSAAVFCFMAMWPAFAQENVAAFYKDKTIRLVVGVAAGSGYDINARAVARHMGKHIPGNPKIIVQNQPGAGSITMTNAVYAQGPFDGTVIGASFNGMPTASLLQPEGVRFDPTQLNWLGSTNREVHVTYVWHTSPVENVEDLKTRELVTGAQAPGTTQYDFPMAGEAFLGLKFKVIKGYESTPAIHLAMERGEIQGNGASAWSTLKSLNSDWLEQKKIKVIGQWGFRKSPDLADVPSFLDMAKTEADRQALRLVMARLEYGRPFFLPPNVPPPRVDALRRAFEATMKDPEFLAEAERLKLDVDPIGGEQTAELVKQVAATPAEVVARVRAALEAK